MSVSELVPRVGFPDVIQATTASDAVRCLGSAAYTLYASPTHNAFHIDVARLSEHDQPVPLELPIEQAVRQVRYETFARHSVAEQAVPKLSGVELTRLGGILIQFADYTPRLHNITTPYTKVENLREAVVARAAADKPLSLAEQLDVALEQSQGDLPEALWQLFITSRQHARWLDNHIIHGLPEMDHTEKVALMKQWHDSVRAFKERRPGLAQDVGGDTYYAWTHALAKVAFTLMPARPSAATRAATKVFHHGTTIMHTLVHKVAHTQSVKSDHTLAAAYGNALGDACIEALALPTAKHAPQGYPEAA